MAMTDNQLRAMVASLKYPGNQDYDPISLEPVGKTTAKRVAIMERNLPQLFAGGKSLLDIGSNKGLIPFWLRDRYETIVGYEMSTACTIAEAVRERHDLDHIQFIQESFRKIHIGKSHKVGQPPRLYEVVYCGSVHHHFVKDALLHGAPMFLPLKKLAALAEKHLILDGPFSFDNDCSLQTWEKEYGWGPEVRAAYTFAAHVEALKPQFELVHGPLANERGRESAVFKRVAPDVPHLEVTAAELLQLQQSGKTIQANNARAPGSMFRVGDERYKIDRGLQTDGVFGVLNSLPEWFAKTLSVIVCDGKRVGDVAEWVTGRPVTRPREIAYHWLRMNDILACIGLVEIHFKIGDFVIRNDNFVDVDVDMMADVDNIATAAAYLSRWKLAGPAKALGPGIADWISHSLGDEWVFQKAAVKLRKFRGE